MRQSNCQTLFYGTNSLTLHVTVILEAFYHIHFFFLSLCIQEDLRKETLLQQFKIVKNHTDTSHVQQYGNKVRTRRLCKL